MSTRSSAKPLKPDFTLEDQNEGPVCGLDEVGRGPLAGPVMAACVYMPPNIREMAFVSQIRDSKTLSKTKLGELYAHITQTCIYAIAACSPREIDEMNILQASLKAMERALQQTEQTFKYALIDGNHCPKNLPCPAKTVIKGDSKSISIAAASILAKVSRDQLMCKLAKHHPHYGWETNVGYPSKAHLAAIEKFGITPHHRTTFAPVKKFIESKSIKPSIRVSA